MRASLILGVVVRVAAATPAAGQEADDQFDGAETRYKMGVALFDLERCMHQQRVPLRDFPSTTAQC
jgi:hypothetical protein